MQLRLPEGQFSVRWLDPKHGGKLLQGSVKSVQAAAGGMASLGKSHSAPYLDWPILVRKE